MKCPVCKIIQDDKLSQCENCGLIFSKYNNLNLSVNQKIINMAKQFLKFSIKLLLFLILLSFIWIYIHRPLNFLSIYKKEYPNISVAPLGKEIENLDYAYISGRIFLKIYNSTLIPLKKVIISFENSNEKREIMSHNDGFYEISLKQDTYMVTVFYPENNMKIREKIDLRKVGRLNNKNFVLAE
ncbi:hypothetical protein HY745_06285 [Candidatus Desantisbacteria bacterium]|nr:hypothetical protein [Candidatus Desantisbacteria bacterium]